MKLCLDSEMKFAFHLEADEVLHQVEEMFGNLTNWPPSYVNLFLKLDEQTGKRLDGGTLSGNED